RNDGPAFLAASLDEDLIRLEISPVHAEAAAFELFELTGLERGADGPELLAELRAEHGQVRLHAQLARVDDAELDVLDADLLGNLVRVRRHTVRALDDEAAQRLAELDARQRAGLATELDHAANL